MEDWLPAIIINWVEKVVKRLIFIEFDQQFNDHNVFIAN